MHIQIIPLFPTVNQNINFAININGLSGGKEETPELISPFFKNSYFEYKIL